MLDRIGTPPSRDDSQRRLARIHKRSDIYVLERETTLLAIGETRLQQFLTAIASWRAVFS